MFVREHCEQVEMPALARSLLMLRGWSVRELARRAKVSHSGLAEWLKNQPGRLSADRVGEALAVLGAPGGALAPGVVHRWEVRDRDGLAALAAVLATAGPGWVLIPVAFAGGITLPPVPLYALRRGEVRALVKYRPRFGVAAADAYPTPDRLQGWASYPPGVDQASPRRIDDALGRGWWDGGDVAVEVFDGLFGGGAIDQDVTWDDVRRAAAAAGLTPADLLQFCSTRSTK